MLDIKNHVLVQKCFLLYTLNSKRSDYCILIWKLSDTEVIVLMLLGSVKPLFKQSIKYNRPERNRSHIVRGSFVLQGVITRGDYTY